MLCDAWRQGQDADWLKSLCPPGMSCLLSIQHNRDLLLQILFLNFLGRGSFLALNESQKRLGYLHTIVVAVRPVHTRGVDLVTEDLGVVPELEDLAYDLARELWVPLHRDRLAREEEALGGTDVVLAEVLRALGI